MIEKNLEITYQYTQELIQEHEANLTRMENKSSLFIGFSGILIRLALDLQSNTFIQQTIRISVVSFAFLSILVSCLSLIGKPVGEIALPEDLMNQEWLSELSPDQYRAYIINGWIDTMNQYKEAARKRRVNIAWIVVFFCCASLLFTIGVGIS